VKGNNTDDEDEINEKFETFSELNHSVKAWGYFINL
jgi:hypothetical protein